MDAKVHVLDSVALLTKQNIGVDGDIFQLGAGIARCTVYIILIISFALP